MACQVPYLPVPGRNLREPSYELQYIHAKTQTSVLVAEKQESQAFRFAIANDEAAVTPGGQR